MKNHYRTGIAFGIGMATFFIIRNVMVFDPITTKQLIKTIVAALVAGAILGFIFGWLLGLQMKQKK